MKSLAYEGLQVSFHVLEGPEALPVPGQWPKRAPADEEYLLSRDGPKKAKVVPSEVSEVVNLSQDYDRWEQFEAPPPTEDER